MTGKLLTLDRALGAGPAGAPARSSTCRSRTPPWQALDPPQRRQRTLDALKRLLLRESQVQPLLVVFEDLHWIDAETQALLDSLVESLPTARLLLLVNYRPEYQHALGRQDLLHAAPAGPPAAGERRRSCSRPCSGGDAGARAAEAAPDRAHRGQSVLPGGERADAWSRRGARRASAAPTGWRRRSETIQVPATVQAVLAARIDRLPPEDKRAPPDRRGHRQGRARSPLLRPSPSCPRRRCAAASRSLQAAEFLYETSLFPDLEYTFKHALTHEVAYGEPAPGPATRASTREIVAAIETLLSRPARRARRAPGPPCVPGRGVGEGRPLPPAGRRQGRRALGLPGGASAASSRRSTRSRISRQTRETAEQAIDLRLELRNALCARWASSNGVLEHAPRGRGARRGARTTSAARAGSRPALASMLWSGRSRTRALEAAPAGPARSARRLGDARSRRGDPGLGAAICRRASIDEAAEHLRQSVALFRGDRLRERLGLAGSRAAHRAQLARLGLAELGEFAEAIGRGERGRPDRRADDRHAASRRLRASLGYVSSPGRLAAAPSPRSSARVAAVPELNRPPPRRLVGAARATRTRWPGASRRASRCSRRRVSRPPRRPARTIVAAPWSGSARRICWPDRLERARAGRRRGLELARGRGARRRGVGPAASSARSPPSADPPDAEAAEAHYRQALALADELGMRPLVAHCHLGLGKLYRRTGERREGPRAPHHRDDDVPRDGHALLAGAGGGGGQGVR